MSSMQVEIIKIIVGVIGVIASMIVLYYSLRNKDIEYTNKEAQEVKVARSDEKNIVKESRINSAEETYVLGEETDILENADGTVLLEDENKDDTVCL